MLQQAKHQEPDLQILPSNQTVRIRLSTAAATYSSFQPGATVCHHLAGLHSTQKALGDLTRPSLAGNRKKQVQKGTPDQITGRPQQPTSVHFGTETPAKLHKVVNYNH